MGGKALMGDGPCKEVIKKLSETDGFAAEVTKV